MAPVRRRLKLDEIFTFLDVLEQFPIIWNTRLKEYSDKSKRERQTVELLEELARRNVNMDEEEYRVRFKSIKDTYRKEFHRVNQSTKRGDALYTPRLAWYERADTFMRDVVCTRFCPSVLNDGQVIAVCSPAGSVPEFYEQGTHWVSVFTAPHTLDQGDQAPRDEGEQEVEETVPAGPPPGRLSHSSGRRTRWVSGSGTASESTEEDSVDIEIIENNSIEYDPHSTTVIKSEPLDSPEIDVITPTYEWNTLSGCNSPSLPITPIASILPTPCKLVTTTTKADLCLDSNMPAPTSEPPFKKPKTEDRFDVYGKNIAYKLREMDKMQRILAEKIINDALFEGEMGALTRDHKLVDESQAVSNPEVHDKAYACSCSIDEKVKQFLDKKGLFFQGLPLTDEEITLAISTLSRSQYVLDKTPSYKVFLKKYGSIYGSSLYMSGPICDKYEGYKVQYIVEKHNSFDDYFKDLVVEEQELKYYWLIAEYKENFYYIDSSDGGQGYIYCVDLCSRRRRPKLFAKDFSNFLDELFKAHQEEDSDKSENEDYDESENEDSDVLVESEKEDSNQAVEST